MTIADLVFNSAARYPTNTALVYRNLPMPYSVLYHAVRTMARGLAASGVRSGDRIAILLPNCPQFVIAYYAAAAIGAVVVPGNPLLKPPELRYMWRDSEVVAVITAGPLLASVQAAREGLDSLRLVVSTTEREELPADAAESIAGFAAMSELMSGGVDALAAGDLPESPAQPDDCAVIIYTSGTTGHPKGAMLSHRNLLRNVEQVQGALYFDETDRFLTILPLFHAFAATVCMHTALSAGCAMVLMDSFSPARALEMIEKYGVTIFPAVPAIFGALLQYPPDRDYNLSSLRLLVSGGAPLPAVTLEALEARYGVPVIEGDGPTECSPATSVNPLAGPRKVGSVGLPLPGVEIAIFDDNDAPLPPEGIGEIVVRGDNVMLGYLNQPEATAEAMTSGWYHTGDIGKIDSDGYVYILDRKKDMVLVGGLNVYPREVEEALLQHPAVADAAVVGLPDAVRGEEVTAVVVLRAGQTASDRELIALCRALLANYKVPRRVLFRETLPRGATGKVVKRLLRKELELENTD